MLRAHEKDSKEWILEKVADWEAENWDPDETEDEIEEVGVEKSGGLGIEGAGNGNGDGDTEMMLGGLSSKMPITS